MKVACWCFGGKNEKHYAELIVEWTQRLSKWTDFEWRNFKNVRSTNLQFIQAEETKMLLESKLEKDFLILVDERGKQLNSLQLATSLQLWSESKQRIIFCVGSAYGFSETIKQEAYFVLALSQLTLPHQLARMVLAEQLYRGFSIVHHHPYHHA